MSFTYIDLFSGIGGFRIALDKMRGSQSLGYSEIDKTAIEYYCKNFNDSPENNFGDITKIESLPDHDLLVGGIPCQSWSISGKGLGFDDERGQLWNDAIYLLKKSQPKAFIFENVKGLLMKRNEEAFKYILSKIKDAGYYANYFLLSTHDFGSIQTRERVFIVGFKEEKYLKSFQVKKYKGDEPPTSNEISSAIFTDIRNSPRSIHSWDIIQTTERQKHICLTLMRGRRYKNSGVQSENPLSLEQLQALDYTITEKELQELVELKIFREVDYEYTIQLGHRDVDITGDENVLLGDIFKTRVINMGELNTSKLIKKYKVNIKKTINSLLEKDILRCTGQRYNFVNSKNSSGINGIYKLHFNNRLTYPTLTATDTLDFITERHIDLNNFKQEIINILKSGDYRKITKDESLSIQGFPMNYQLPEKRSKWMKLIGNSVSPTVVVHIAQGIRETGVFNE